MHRHTTDMKRSCIDYVTPGHCIFTCILALKHTFVGVDVNAVVAGTGGRTYVRYPSPSPRKLLANFRNWGRFHRQSSALNSPNQPPFTRPLSPLIVNQSPINHQSLAIIRHTCAPTSTLICTVNPFGYTVNPFALND